jgi:glycosyltransferase involved in cell wall biosynthesis
MSRPCAYVGPARGANIASPMKIYWYAPWPTDRPWASVELAKHIVDDGDEMVLHVLRNVSGVAPALDERVQVVADLPVVATARAWSPRWLVNRAAFVIERARKRNALVRRLRPDVVHLQLLNRFTDIWMMPRGSVVVTIHDVLPHHRRLPHGIERAVLGALYSRLDAIVVHHPAVADQLVAEFAVIPDRVRYIPLVIAPNGHETVLRDLASPTILFFGAFRRNKGIAQLCEAIGLLGPDEPFRFHFAGRGHSDEEDTVKELASRDSRVTADIGYVTNDVKEALFRSAALVVLPYTAFTSQSAVLGDAYAAGTPVLVADVGALGVSVRDDGTGWILPSTQADDIARSIRQSLSDADAWSARAERCIAVASQRAPDVVARSYRDLYASIATR